MSIRRQRHEEKPKKDENKKEDKPEKESAKEVIISTVSVEPEKKVDETVTLPPTKIEEIIDHKTKKYDSVGIMGNHESIGVFKRRVLGKGFKIGKVIVELINEWLLKNP